MERVVQFVMPYTSPVTDSSLNVRIVNEHHAPLFLLSTCIPSLTDVDLITKGLNSFVEKCNELNPPKNDRISEKEMKLVLEVAQRKYRLLDISASYYPLKIICFNNSHNYYNSMCGLTDKITGNEAVLLIFHPNDVDIYDRVFIFAHELGHALHLALTGNVEITPNKFDDFNAGLNITGLTLKEKQENFADAVAIAILNSDELRSHQPTGLNEVLPPYFDKYIAWLSEKHFEKLGELPF